MYVQHVVYDSSCNYQTDIGQPSVAPEAMFNLAKDYLYIIQENVAAGEPREDVGN